MKIKIVIHIPPETKPFYEPVTIKELLVKFAVGLIIILCSCTHERYIIKGKNHGIFLGTGAKHYFRQFKPDTTHAKDIRILSHRQ